jgi:hypothetical protein
VGAHLDEVRNLGQPEPQFLLMDLLNRGGALFIGPHSHQPPGTHEHLGRIVPSAQVIKALVN